MYRHWLSIIKKGFVVILLGTQLKGMDFLYIMNYSWTNDKCEMKVVYEQLLDVREFSSNLLHDEHALVVYIYTSIKEGKLCELVVY